MPARTFHHLSHLGQASIISTQGGDRVALAEPITDVDAVQQCVVCFRHLCVNLASTSSSQALYALMADEVGTHRNSFAYILAMNPPAHHHTNWGTRIRSDS